MIHTDRRRAKDLYSQHRDMKQLRQRKQSLLRKNKPIIRQGDDPDEEENIILTNGIQTARIRNGHVIGDDEEDFIPESADEVAMESDAEDASVTDTYGLGVLTMPLILRMRKKFRSS